MKEIMWFWLINCCFAFSSVSEGAYGIPGEPKPTFDRAGSVVKKKEKKNAPLIVWLTAQHVCGDNMVI